ncbi:MAG: GNAT family N-acetyltransferase [Bacteroidales bacterium]|nr:GNAT family N-acetyltransferase [Bacteroidales bacterium]
MKLKKYGITLSRLQLEDIELVRNWRNSKTVRDNMEFREYITPEMQKKWFHSINNINNLFFIIEYNNEKIGLLNDKNIDWKKRISESGFFLGIQKYYNTFVPILVSLCGIESTFYFMNWNISYARILKNNHRAINFNTNLGYQLCEGQENVENQKYFLTRQNFELKAKKIRQAAHKLTGSDDTTYFILEKYDYDKGYADFFEDIVKNSNYNIKSKITDKEKIFYYKPEFGKK